MDLRNTTIEKANLTPGEFDYAFSISVIEHLPWNDVEHIMRETYRSLKPGGRFILTVDLFPDISPFCETQVNKYGSNINIRKMVEIENFELLLGNKSQLYGYPEFKPQQILDHQSQFLVGGGYPVLVQCIVLKKPEHE